MGWYPGMTSAHGSVIAKLFCGDESNPETSDDGDQDSAREFLISVSAVTMANAFFNIVALFVIMRARSGALHMAQEVLGEGIDPWSPAEMMPPAFALLAFSAAVAAVLACPLTIFLGRMLAKLYDRVPYQRLMAGIVCFLIALLFIFSGVAGLLVTCVAVCLGLVPPLAGVRRVHLMGSILVPVMIYFLGVGPGVISFLGF
jgi:putative membrane protein